MPNPQAQGGTSIDVPDLIVEVYRDTFGNAGEWVVELKSEGDSIVLVAPNERIARIAAAHVQTAEVMCRTGIESVIPVATLPGRTS